MACALPLCFAGPAALALDFSRKEDQLAAYIKLRGDLKGKETFADFHIDVYGVLPGERPLRADAVRVARLTARHPRIGLLCSWPPHEAEWPAEAFALLAPGQLLAYIGEDCGGCCGSDAMFDVLYTEFQLVDEHALRHPEGIHDSLQIWRRL